MANKMIQSLNSELKTIASRMADIENADKRDDAAMEEYKGLVVKGKALRAQLDSAQEAEALKATFTVGTGSVVETAFKHAPTQELTSPADREQEQRAEDNAHKSAYKAVFEKYLRGGQHSMTANDQKILAGGALKALTEGVGNAGGYTVPEDFRAEILKKQPGLIGLVDTVRRVPTTRDTLVFPKVVYTTNNQYTAPHRLTFTGEVPTSATVHAVTDQTFGQSRIPVNLAMASQKISNSLVEDGAIDVLALTAELFRENILQDVEYYIAQGTGSGQPEGLTVNTNAQTNKVVSGSAATLTTNGLVALYWQTPAQYRANAKFVFSSSTAEVIAKLADSNGRYMWQASDMFGGGLGQVQSDGVIIKQPMLLGAPVVISEQMPAVTTNSFPVAFGDMRGYIMAERAGMSVQVLRELYAETDQVLYLLRYRFGGQLSEDYKVKLQKCST